MGLNSEKGGNRTGQMVFFSSLSSLSLVLVEGEPTTNAKVQWLPIRFRQDDIKPTGSNLKSDEIIASVDKENENVSRLSRFSFLFARIHQTTAVGYHAGRHEEKEERGNVKFATPAAA